MTVLLRRVIGALSTPGPSVGVEIASDGVTAAAVSWVKSTPRVTGHAHVPLAPGALTPTAAGINMTDRDAVADAVRRVFEQLPRRPTRIGLVLPDSAAKVSFVRFDHVPGHAADLERLIAWQVRKAVPYRVEDAQLAYTPGVRLQNGAQEYIVALIRRDIVEEYEGVCAAAGAHAGLVDLATFSLVNAAVAMSPSTQADWLLVHVAREYSTLAIVRGQDLIFFRNRALSADADLSDLVHQSAMYYQDRLEGRGLARTILVVSSAAAGASVGAQQMLEERFGVDVERLALGRFESALGVDPSALDPLAAPLGLVMRERLLAA